MEINIFPVTLQILRPSANAFQRGLHGEKVYKISKPFRGTFTINFTNNNKKDVFCNLNQKFISTTFIQDT